MITLGLALLVLIFVQNDVEMESGHAVEALP